MMIKKIFFLILTLFFQSAYSLVTCTYPASCSPACNSSCSTSSCSQVMTHNFVISVLPVTVDIEPASACAHSAVTANSFPLLVDGINHPSLPATVVHNYSVCVDTVHNGATCPPPATLPVVVP
jgi:hypothetical protein